jgi:cytochrome bd-type quinol oxidase subunit 2
MPFLAYATFAIIGLAVLLYVLMDGGDLGGSVDRLLALDLGPAK